MQIEQSIERAQSLAQNGDARGALAALESLRPALSKSPDLALFWFSLARRAPSHKGVVDQAREALSAFPHDERVVLAATSAILAHLDERSFDEQATFVHQSAELAAHACATCRAALGVDARAKFDPAGALLCTEANARVRMFGDDAMAQAEDLFAQAIEIDPSRGSTFFDLGLARKRRGAWQASFDAMTQARALLGDEKRVLWNYAIAATALGKGEFAADAWRALGLPATVSPGGMPFVEGVPPVDVRVPTRGTGHRGSHVPDEAIGFEIVSVAPLSPCHGVVQSPTFRQSPADWGDVILWDGSPIFVQQEPGQPPRPLFALLARLVESDDHRLPFIALSQSANDFQALAKALGESVHVVVQDERVEHVCPRCAAGDTLRKHEHEPAEDHRVVYGKLLAPASTDLKLVRAALERALKTVSGIYMAVPRLYERLGETALAGKQHQAWGGIEKTGMKRVIP